MLVVPPMNPINILEPRRSPRSVKQARQSVKPNKTHKRIIVFILLHGVYRLYSYVLDMTCITQFVLTHSTSNIQPLRQWGQQVSTCITKEIPQTKESGNTSLISRILLLLKLHHLEWKDEQK